MAYFLTSILMITLLVNQLEGRDLGVYGATASIEEEDLMHFLHHKMQGFSKEDFQVLMQAMQSDAISQLKKPMEVKDMTKTKVYSATYYDPSIDVDRDIRNHANQIIVKKGTHFNPLSKVSLYQDLLFFDATDPEQLSWAESIPSSTKWILTKGQPIDLEEKLNRPVYFDQGGMLTKKFGIRQVPARVSQEGIKLKIEFIPVGDS